MFELWRSVWNLNLTGLYHHWRPICTCVVSRDSEHWDATTARFTFKIPDPYFLKKLSFLGFDPPDRQLWPDRQTDRMWRMPVAAVTEAGSKQVEMVLLLLGEQVLMSLWFTPACKHSCCSASTSDLILQRRRRRRRHRQRQKRQHWDTAQRHIERHGLFTSANN